MAKGVRVVVTDLETGDSDETVIWDDYLLVVAGSAELSRVHTYVKTGTHQITVKGVKRS